MQLESKSEHHRTVQIYMYLKVDKSNPAMELVYSGNKAENKFVWPDEVRHEWRITWLCHLWKKYYCVSYKCNLGVHQNTAEQYKYICIWKPTNRIPQLNWYILAIRLKINLCDRTKFVICDVSRDSVICEKLIGRMHVTLLSREKKLIAYIKMLPLLCF